MIECCNAVDRDIHMRKSIIEYLLNALEIAINNKISDDGGPIGVELTSNMNQFQAKAT